MEKRDYKDENETNFVSTALDLEASLAQTLFGYGFQPTTTWMDYITHAFMDINYEGDNLTSIELGLGVDAMSNGTYSNQLVSYTIDNFGTTSVAEVEAFLAPYMGE